MATYGSPERRQTIQQIDIGTLLSTLDADSNDITNVAALDSDRTDVNSPAGLGSVPSPFRMAHDPSQGLIFAAQNSQDDGTNEERKIKAWFYNDDGSERLSEWAPSETKEIVPGERGVEWSQYIRTTRLSEAQQLRKWLNVEQAGTAASDGEYYPQIQYRNADHFGIQGPQNEPTTMRFIPTHANAKQFLTWRDDSFNNDVRIEHDLEFDQWRLKDARAGNSVLGIELGSATLTHFQATSESVVWESDTTANRPSSPVEGQRFFDADLGQPIWYDGSGWITADGTSA